jgi:hypothetical protein
MDIMKVFKLAASCMVIFALASCGSSKADNQQDSDSVIAQMDSLQAADSATSQPDAADQSDAQEAADHAANYKVIQTVYDKFVFNFSESSPRSYFTANALKKLAQAYDMDCDDGNCYAYSELRTANEDGPSDTQKVVSIEPAEDGWYVVSYNDMGNNGKTKIKMVDGKIDDYKRIK